MAFSLCTLANVSELSYIDAVRTTVRTTVLILFTSISEFRYVDAVRTQVRTKIFKKHILFALPPNEFPNN